MKYSLANYILSIKIPQELKAVFGEDFIVGGAGDNQRGSYTTSIDVSRNQDLYTLKADATGSWVHEKNLNQSGTISVNLNQMAPVGAKLTKLFYALSAYSGNQEITMTICGNDSTPIITANDCVLANIPDLQLQSSVNDRTWTFNCGQVIYNQQ